MDITIYEICSKSKRKAWRFVACSIYDTHLKVLRYSTRGTVNNRSQSLSVIHTCNPQV